MGTVSFLCSHIVVMNIWPSIAVFMLTVSLCPHVMQRTHSRRTNNRFCVVGKDAFVRLLCARSLIAASHEGGNAAMEALLKLKQNSMKTYYSLARMVASDPTLVFAVQCLHGNVFSVEYDPIISAVTVSYL